MTTNAQGEFELTGLSRDVEHGVHVRVQGVGVSWRVVPPGDGGDIGTLVVRPAVTVRGRVVDHDGRSVIGAKVSMSGPGLFLRARTDREGVFLLRGVPASGVELSVWLGLARVLRMPVERSVSETIDLGVLQADTRVRSVRGRIVTEASETLERSTVALSKGRGNPIASGKVYGDGYFELSAIAGEEGATALTLELRNDSGRDVRASWSVQADDTPITLVIP